MQGVIETPRLNTNQQKRRRTKLEVPEIVAVNV